MTSAAPPTEFFPGINFNASFYNLGQSAVTLDYLNSNFLRSTGYAISRAQFTLFNGTVDINENLDVSGNINASAYLLNGQPFESSKWTKIGNNICYNDPSGNVGIGTSTLLAGVKLHVAGGSYFESPVSLNSAVNTSFFWRNAGNTLLGRNNGANAYSANTGIGDLVLSSGVKLHLKTGATANGSALTVDLSNNIGIGTTAPTYKLDVSGSINTTQLFIGGTQLIPYTDTNTRSVLSNSAGTNMTWNTGTNKFDVAAPYSDTNTRTVLSTSAGTNMTWNTGTNKFDVAAPYTDTNTRNVLFNSAGTNMTWNTGTNKFDVAAPPANPWVSNTSGIFYSPVTVPIGQTNFVGINTTSPLFNLDVSGSIFARTNYLLGTLNTTSPYGWVGTSSFISRVNTAGNILTGSLNDDIVIRSGAGRVNLMSGTGLVSALAVATNNNVVVSNNLMVGRSTLTTGFSLDVSGNVNTNGGYRCGDNGSISWSLGSGALGRANGTGQYSSSAVAGDVVLRSGTPGHLILQHGTGAASITITPSDTAGVTSSTRIGGNMTINDNLFFNFRYRGVAPNVFAFGCNKIDFTAGSRRLGFGTSGPFASEADVLDYFTNTSHRFYTGTGVVGPAFDTGVETFRIQNGGLYFQENVWHRSLSGNERLYFAPGSTTYYRGFTTVVHVWRNGADATIAYFALDGGLWIGNTIVQNSDRRIKENIQDINDDEALNKILALEPKTYEYIDKKMKGNVSVYGFIAQQVKEVIPHAVKTVSQTICNIYKDCDCDGDIIYVSILQDVAINTEIQLIDVSGVTHRHKIIEINEDYIKIDKVLEVDNIFVYGYNIDDMHTMTKEYIYTLNVCATQILSRKIDEQKNKINDLETKMARLELLLLSLTDNNSQ